MILYIVVVSRWSFLLFDDEQERQVSSPSSFSMWQLVACHAPNDRPFPSGLRERTLSIQFEASEQMMQVKIQILVMNDRR